MSSVESEIGKRKKKIIYSPLKLFWSNKKCINAYSKNEMCQFTQFRNVDDAANVFPRY